MANEHNHDHGHDHDHGHEHGHEHGHDCDCGCEHDHNHEIETEIRDGVKIERHEGATICSLDFDADGDYADVKTTMSVIMKELADKIDAAGDIVGHIKGYLSYNKQGVMLSTTGGDVTIRKIDSVRLTINIVAIAFVADEDAFIATVGALRESFVNVTNN